MLSKAQQNGGGSGRGEGVFPEGCYVLLGCHLPTAQTVLTQVLSVMHAVSQWWCVWQEQRYRWREGRSRPGLEKWYVSRTTQRPLSVFRPHGELINNLSLVLKIPGRVPWASRTVLDGRGLRSDAGKNRQQIVLPVGVPLPQATPAL